MIVTPIFNSFILSSVIIPVSKTFEPYSKRSIRFQGLKDIAGYQLKIYSILHEKRTFNEKLLLQALDLSATVLPQPAVNDDRPGVGFLILHQGLTADYLILSWWDNENELPTYIFVYDKVAWRMAHSSESFCVWDIEVMWQEREFYVSTFLTKSCADKIGAYLSKNIGNYPFTTYQSLS